MFRPRHSRLGPVSRPVLLRAFVFGCAVLLQVGCAPAMANQARTGPTICAPGAGALCEASVRSGGIEVVDSMLDARIGSLLVRSPSFRDAWEMIGSSGVPVTIGTAEQLRREIPSSYRKNPTSWAGVTVARSASSGRGLDRAFVALHVRLIEDLASGAQVDPRGYVVGEIDRVLVHEIYGHLAPMVDVEGGGRECPDYVRPGEELPCVVVRERHVAEELSAADGLG